MYSPGHYGFILTIHWVSLSQLIGYLIIKNMQWKKENNQVAEQSFFLMLFLSISTSCWSFTPLLGQKNSCWGHFWTWLKLKIELGIVSLGQEYAHWPKNSEINFLNRWWLFISIYSHFQSFLKFSYFQVVEYTYQKFRYFRPWWRVSAEESKCYIN